MLKRLAFLTALAFLCLTVDAQVTINAANFNTTSYGAGGNITVPISLTGCFAQGNTFELYLSDASGNFSPGTLIGSYNSFFTPFVNGVIPAGTTPGAGYKVRVVATNPAFTSAASNAFSIVATGSSPVANPTTTAANTIAGNDSTFGKCVFVTSPSNISLTVTVPAGTTMSAVVLNKTFGVVGATVTPPTINFSMQSGQYYTVQVTIKNNSDNSVSIRSFLVLASTNNLNFQTSGSNEICLPDSANYIINTAGIINNYPGTVYNVDWGDGTNTNFTQCQLIANGGLVTHSYTTTSCGRPPITDIIPNQYNAYKVNLTASNQFCASSSYTPISSYAKVWSRPLADFVNPEYGCLNTPITFANTSQTGLAGYNNAQNCTNATTFEWYVDGALVSTATNLNYSFNTTGNHSVQLVAVNEPCSDDTTMIICIESTPQPDFKLNGADVLSGCTGLVADVTNTSNLANGCRPYTFNWSVVKVPGPAVLNTDYTYQPNPTDSTPRFTFLTPGTYYIRLTVSNSCGTFFDEDTVTIKLDADVTLPPNATYCGLQNINFAVNVAHMPVYNTNAGTETYQWTITPGTFTFLSGNANSAYPVVQFNAYGTYNIKIKFTNDCGVDSATQQILFYQPVTVGAGSDQNVCYTVNTVNLSGTSSGPPGYSASWSAVPGFGTTGNISNVNIANPTYTFTPTDKTNGVVRLVYTATPPGGSVCPAVTDTVYINIYPDNSITSASTKTICSGTSVAYNITALLGGSTFTWTSSVISGAATGNTASGSTATINDVLTNSSNSANAVVRYVITPVANGCNGNPFNFDVTVKPLPDLNATPSATTLCSGDQLTITLTSALGSAQYTWSSSPVPATLTGNSNQPAPVSTGSIVNTLTNTGSADVTLTYTIVAYNTGTPVCTGQSQQVIVTIRPPVNASAGSNSPVCSGQTINLSGNSTNPGATFSWTGPNSFTSNQQNPSITNAIPANAGTYTLIATAGGCPSPAATTNVVVNTTSTIGGFNQTNPTSCGSATGSITLTGLAASTSYTVNYTFNSNPATPVTLSTNASGDLVIPNLAAGTYNNITVGLSGCGSNAVGPISLTDPSAPNTPTAGSNSPICSGTTLTLNANTSSPGVATWTWSGPNSFSSNSQNPSITNATVAATGTYNVTVTINNCTSAAGTVNVVVNPTPAVPTAGSNSPVCSNGTLNLTANSATGGVSYAWTGPNSFNSGVQNPSVSNVTLADAGTYSVTATLGSCTSAAGTTNVVINPTPNISSFTKSDPTNCATATGSITLNGLANNTSYTVNYIFAGNPVSATISSNASGSVVIPNLVAGTYSNITVTLAGCVSNVAGPISLFDPSAPPAPTAGSNDPICSGNTLNLTATTGSPGVATWAWSGPNSFSSNSQNPSITNATLAAAGTYSVTVTINSCTSPAGTVNVVVNQTPATPSAGSNTPVCSGNTLNLTSSTSTVGAINYAWTGPNSFTSNVQNPSITTVTTAASGTYSVTASLGTCTSAAGTTNVVINPTPNISGSSFTDPGTCASSTGSISLSGLTPSTPYTVDYTQGATPQTAVIATNAGGVLIIPNLPAGTYSNVSVTLNGCPSNIVGPFTLSDPTPPAVPVAGSNGPICSGNNLLLTSNSATPGVTYSWTGPNGFASGVQNPTINNAAVTDAGTYNVTATLNGCTSAAGTVNVVINPTPVTPTAGSNSPVCSGNTLNLTASTPSAGVTYAWTGPNGFNNSQQNPSITNVSVAAAGLYVVVATATAGNCPSAPGGTTVIINPTPNISGGTGNNPTSCASTTGSITLTGLTASTSYTVNYTEGATPQTIILSTDGTGALVIPNLASGTYSNISVTLNGCPSNVVGPFTLSDPTPPAVPVAGSNGPICSGNTLNLTANSATPGVTYTWSGPNSFSSTTQNPTINNAPVAAAGTYSVTATLNSCTSAAGTVNVVINPTPTAPTAGSNTPVCSGNTLNLTASTPSAGVTYAWTGPNSFSDATQNPSIANVTTAASGVYSVIATTTVGNCPSTAGTTTVVINPTPNISGTSFSNPTDCASSTGTITLTGLTASTSYTVNYTQGATPQTATILSDGTGALVIPNLPAGTYSNISVTLNGCPSNVVGPFTLSDPTPPATPVAGSNGPICSGNTLNLTASTASPGTATWAWSGPNSFSSATQNPSITNATTLATGTYSVTVTINSCTSPAGTVNVVVNQTPATPVVTSNTPVCSDSTLQLGATTTTPGTMTWAWTGPNSFSSIVQNPSITNVTTAANGTYTVVATATTGNCPSAPGSASVVINPTPVITTSSFTHPTNCNTATGTITLNGLSASTSYTVQYDKNSTPQTATISTDAAGTLIIPNLTAGTYSNVRVVLTGCPSNIVGPFTLNDPNPPATPTAGSNSPICSGNALTLTASTTSVGAITYAWTGPNSFSSNVQNPTIPSATLAANGVYSVTATLNSCVSLPGSVTVTVNETPATPVVGSNSPVCSDSTLLLTASTTFAGAVTWSWTGPNSFASSSQNPSIVSVTTAANGVYNVVATSTVGTCPSVAGTTTVVINPTPVIAGTSFTNPTQCFSSTGTITLNGLATNTTFTVTYTQNGNPITTSITSDGTGAIIIANLPAGIYANIKVTSLAGCPSNTVGPITLSDPNPPATPVAGSNSPICTGETLNLTSSTTTPGAIVYAWTGPNSFTSATQNPSILNAQPVQSGWYYVSATLNNCTSLRDSVLVDIAALPAGPTVTTPVNYCINTTAVPLTATALPGNSLRWYTVAVGGTFSTTAPTPSTAVTGTTDYYVSQVTPLGCEGARSLIQVIVNPDATAQYNFSPTEACAPFNINSSVIQPVLYPTRNSVYEWYANDVLIGTGTTFPGYIINLPGDSVRIKLKTISLFGCKNDSTENWFYTTPKPVTDFTASDTVGCGPLSVSFTNTTPLITHFNYLWNFGNGVTSTQTNPGTITYQPNPNAGDTVYHVSLQAFTLCDTVIKNIDIRVKSKPKALFTPSTTYGCSPLPVTFTNTSLGANMTFTWDFGDGSATIITTNTSPVQHTYHTAQQDTFHVRLIASNECGNDTATYAIVVAARTINLNFTVNGNQITGCAPHTVDFINNSTGATNFIWDFGDGNIRSTTKNIDTVTTVYSAIGSFVVTVKASNGCTDTTGTITINVYRKPIPDFAINPLPACLGDTLQFTNQTDTATGLLWHFGNGVTSQLTNPRYAYTLPGTYDVKLIAVRQYGPGNACSDSITKPVTIVTSLPGVFTASDTVSNCVPFSVIFTNHSLPSSLTTWDYGDGNVDTGDIVSHTYLQVGTYIVTMTARDLGGCRYIASKQIIVNGPAGAFIYDHGYICGNTPVRFEATVTGTDSIRWNFGDGVSITSTNNVVYHVYGQAGNYVPTVRLLAGAGCSKFLQGTDTIKVDYVDAGFKSAQTKICGSTSVSFADTSRAYFGLQSWQWNFGDGNTSGTQNPVHQYSSTNTWPVRLIVTGISGCSDTADVPLFVKVDSKPLASIVAPPTGCVNQPVTYSSVVVSSDPITYYNWTFTNGATGNTPNVINNYALPGSFTGRLIAGTSFGCYDTTTHTITINPTPIVNTNPDMQICRGQSAQLTATGGLTYDWAPFTGLSCTTCPNPVATPLTTTQYVVTGYNSFGCAARDTILITVPQPIDIVVNPSVNICINGSTPLSVTGATSYIWSPGTGLSCTTCPNPVANPTVTTTYRVIGFDAHNCFQDTAFVTVGVGQYPVVNVGPDIVLATGTQQPLTPTATNGPIATWTWNPTNDLSCAGCPTPIVTAKKDICYSVTATNFFGCSGRDTMCIKVFCESSQVFIPNAFTPDGDGVNDRLTVRAKGVKMVKSFRIFNRWGQVVFERANFVPNADVYGWDGRVRGIPAPPDVYVYTCEVVCEDDTPYTFKGNVAIIK